MKNLLNVTKYTFLEVYKMSLNLTDTFHKSDRSLVGWMEFHK